MTGSGKQPAHQRESIDCSQDQNPDHHPLRAGPHPLGVGFSRLMRESLIVVDVWIRIGRSVVLISHDDVFSFSGSIDLSCSGFWWVIPQDCS